jgi:UDP-glucose 4-epimerase
MKNFLITGGAGFVGSHLAAELVTKGNKITILDDLNTGKINNLEKIKEKIDFIKGDIRDLNLLREICKDKDGIFHQAARASVQESFEKPDEYHDVNVKGTENVFTVAKEFGIKVVYASSSSVYGNPMELPIREESAKNPINPYAQTKLDKEKLAIKFAKDGLKVIGLRYLNIFGEGQSKEYAGVIKLFLDRIQQKLPPKINGDGLQARDFVYVGDAVTANILSMESDVSHTFFNVGTGTKISILEIAKIIIKYSGLNLEPIFGPPLKGDVNITLADISHIQNKLNWKPTIFLEEWLKQKIATFNIN